MSGRVAGSIIDLIGGTPMVRLNRIAQGLEPKIFAKLEYFNPGGSVKDRIGLVMLKEAERRGRLGPGSTIVEPTSGNTGMGLALVAIVKGYKVICTVPDKMSQHKVDLLRAVGVEVKVTPTTPPEDPKGYLKLAERIANETPNSYMPNQYENQGNPEAHYASTGPEIWDQTNGAVTVLVAGVGTGGTITGTGRFLKEKNPSIKVVGVDPKGSILASRFRGKSSRPKQYKVEGIGEDFVPKTLDMSVIDEMVTVSDKDAFLTARRLAREEGIIAGGSSGAAVHVALSKSRELGREDSVVVILPDSGRSYTNKQFDDDWMIEHGFIQKRKRKERHGQL